MKEDDYDQNMSVYNPYRASDEMMIRIDQQTLQVPGDSQAVMQLWRIVNSMFRSHTGRKVDGSDLSSGRYFSYSRSVGISLFKAVVGHGAF